MLLSHTDSTARERTVTCTLDQRIKIAIEDIVDHTTRRTHRDHTEHEDGHDGGTRVPVGGNPQRPECGPKQ